MANHNKTARELGDKTVRQSEHFTTGSEEVLKYIFTAVVMSARQAVQLFQPRVKFSRLCYVAEG